MKWNYIIYMLASAVMLFGGLIFNLIKPRRMEIEFPIRMLFGFGGTALFLYAFGIMAEAEPTARILFSGYYIFVNFALLAMVSFVRRYADVRSYSNRTQIVISVAADFDILLMIVNCFKPILFQCVQKADRAGMLFWQVGRTEPFYCYHVAFGVACWSIIMWDLIRKIIKSPKSYKSKYAMILIMDCVFMAVHIAYLYFRLKIDYALLWLPVVCFAIYYYSLYYVPRGLIDKLMFFTISNMEDGVICLDVDNKCVHANKTAKIFCDNEIIQQVETWFAENISGKDESDWKASRRIDGEMRDYEITYKKMFDVDGKSIGGFFFLHDCTMENTRLAAQKYRATHDPLTGIYNKEYFYDKVRKELKKNPDTEYCIVCTDVKNFKIINDVFGVESGDKLLLRIASSISFMAEEHWIYGRLTGDRFAVFLPRAEFIEEKFRQETAKMGRLSENYMFKVQIHIGVYFIEDRSLRISVMCDRANLAIKTVKSSYQNSVAYYKETLREDFLNEQRIINEFDIALRAGQFQAYVQPQVFSEDGKIRGGEVLVRWIHPQTGMIPPYKFIPVFEQTGLIGKLDAYMWELACIKLQEWKKHGLTEHYLSVNISQKDFYLMDIYKTFTSLVERYQIEPRNLHLEITETAIMDNPGEQLPLLSKLREYGFMVEIDDFGSGYSSLNTLKDMNADVLKVDMGFLRKTEHQERSKIILKMVISLAKALRMEVITEGVETKEQVDYLKEYGCDIFQGYHFAKPMPVREFEEKFLNQTVEV